MWSARKFLVAVNSTSRSRSVTAVLFLSVLFMACGNTTDGNEQPVATPDGQGVLYQQTETSAAKVIGFTPIRPAVMPPNYDVQELWVQASLLEGLTSEGLVRWGAPYTAIYTLQPTTDTGLPSGIQFQQSLVDPIPAAPGVSRPWRTVTIGTKQVSKSVNPVGDGTHANIVYRWDAGNLHLLVIATTGGSLEEAEVEAMIASIPD